jgi:hypothetical protein
MMNIIPDKSLVLAKFDIDKPYGISPYCTVGHFKVGRYYMLQDYCSNKISVYEGSSEPPNCSTIWTNLPRFDLYREKVIANRNAVIKAIPESSKKLFEGFRQDPHGFCLTHNNTAVNGATPIKRHEKLSNNKRLRELSVDYSYPARLKELFDLGEGRVVVITGEKGKLWTLKYPEFIWTRVGQYHDRGFQWKNSRRELSKDSFHILYYYLKPINKEDAKYFLRLGAPLLPDTLWRVKP